MLAPTTVSHLEFRWAFSTFNYQLAEQVSLECVPADTSPLWQSALTSVESQCARLEPASSIEFIVSNHLARYIVIPAMPAFTPADQRLAIAVECFRATYGDSVDDWNIRINPLPHAESIIACAVDSALIAGLYAVGEKYKLRVKSLQPHFMSGFNSARQQIRRQQNKATPACFVQMEPDRATIALMRNGGWQAIASGHVTQRWPQEVAAMVGRQMLLANWLGESAVQPVIYLADSRSADLESGRKLSSATDYKVVSVPPAYIHNASPGNQYHDALVLNKG